MFLIELNYWSSVSDLFYYFWLVSWISTSHLPSVWRICYALAWSSGRGLWLERGSTWNPDFDATCWFVYFRFYCCYCYWRSRAFQWMNIKLIVYVLRIAIYSEVLLEMGEDSWFWWMRNLSFHSRNFMLILLQFVMQHLRNMF